MNTRHRAAVRARHARAIACTLLAVCAGVRAAPVTVDIVHFAFAPADITVAPGATVAWVNHDETPHAIRAADGAFASSALDSGDRYERTFAAPGDYPYYCTLHPFMTGVVHVRAGASERPHVPRRSNAAGPHR